MERPDIHEVTSGDGTRIRGRVQGDGPPLVLVHGGLGDGETAFRFMLPYLVDHFTCFSLSTRGRGLSDDHPDHSRDRHFEDVSAFIESIGEPVYVFGHSMGGVWVLGATARTAPNVRAIAVYEPGIPVPGWEPGLENRDDVRRALDEGRLTDAIKITVADVIRLNEDEQTFFLTPPALQIVERNLPSGVLDSAALNQPGLDIAFERLTMPVLLLTGGRTGPHFKEAIRMLAARIDGAVVVELADAGHLGPVLHGEAVAAQLVRRFRS